MDRLKETINKLSFASSFVRLVTADPEKDDLPGLLSRIEDYFSREDVLVNVPGMLERPEVRRALETPTERVFPDLEALRALPAGTLGHIYADTLLRMGFDPSVPDMGARASGRPRNLRNHLAVTHDVWHTVTGIGTDVLGELELQAFQFAQIGAPFHLFTVGMGLLATTMQDLDKIEPVMTSCVRGWLLGRRARSLVGVDWSAWWGKPLDEVRRAFNIDTDGVAAALAS